MKRQKQFEKFLAVDFSLDDAPQSGRPVEIDSDQVKTLIENNQHFFTNSCGFFCFGNSHPNGYKVVGISLWF